VAECRGTWSSWGVVATDLGPTRRDDDDDDDDVATRVFNRPEFLGRHDFQAKKFGRQCTKFGSHAVDL